MSMAGNWRKCFSWIKPLLLTTEQFLRDLELVITQHYLTQVKLGGLNLPWSGKCGFSGGSKDINQIHNSLALHSHVYSLHSPVFAGTSFSKLSWKPKPGQTRLNIPEESKDDSPSQSLNLDHLRTRTKHDGPHGNELCPVARSENDTCILGIQSHHICHDVSTLRQAQSRARLHFSACPASAACTLALAQPHTHCCYESSHVHKANVPNHSNAWKVLCIQETCAPNPNLLWSPHPA